MECTAPIERPKKRPLGAVDAIEFLGWLMGHHSKEA